MYLDHWKLKLMPFENSSDARFFYESFGHQEAVTRLLFAIQTHKAVAMLTGDYGTGKTMVCETVLKKIPPNQFKTAYITNPRMDAIDLTREIAYQLGQEIMSRSTYDVLHEFNNLLDRSFATGRHCVAVLDESQHVMNISILEDLRLLLNHQAGGHFLLTLVFVGQTEFGDMIKAVPQMAQRIGLKFHIPNLQPEEVRAYITQRLQTSGGGLEIFEDAAIQEIGRISKGNPREINALCDLCLLIGALTSKPQVRVDEVQEAARERA